MLITEVIGIICIHAENSQKENEPLTPLKYFKIKGYIPVFDTAIKLFF